MATKVELKTLLESVERGITPIIRASRFETEPFTDTTAFHIYGELNLTLRLTAASDAQDAQRLLRILQEYTLIAEACAAEASAVLLEVQGERVHLLLPSAAPNATSVSDLVRFAIAFTNTVYSRIGKSAGEAFQGFKMAADHGRAILVASAQPSGSVVSLGPCANAPAKELKRNGVAAHLRMRSEHYAHIAQPQNSKEWIDVPVLHPAASIAYLVSIDLNERFSATSSQFLREGFTGVPEVQFADAQFLSGFAGGSVLQPIKVQGFPLRADLDGFSKQVEAAFNSGNTAIAALTQRFLRIMQYPDQFRARVGKTINLPWAGDCATVVVLPNGASYDDAREYLPVKAASEWHNQKTLADLNEQKWSQHIGEAKWAVGVAGGDDQEGSSGYVLIAPLAGRNRDFLVGAGWGIGRSLDAQESDGVAGDDTVIHTVDYGALDSAHKTSFRELNSLFWISRGLTVGSLRSRGIQSLVPDRPIVVPNIAKPVPQPKPWYYGRS